MVEAIKNLGLPGQGNAEETKARVGPLREDYSDVVTNMWIGELIGTPHLGKRGITDEEKEKTSATEEI